MLDSEVSTREKFFKGVVWVWITFLADTILSLSPKQDQEQTPVFHY